VLDALMNTPACILALRSCRTILEGTILYGYAIH